MTAAKTAASAVMAGATVYVPLAELIDFDAEIAKLNKTIDKLNGELTRIDKKLGNQGFIAKAPQAVVDEQKAKREEYSAQLTAAKQRISELESAR